MPCLVTSRFYQERPAVTAHRQTQPPSPLAVCPTLGGGRIEVPWRAGPHHSNHTFKSPLPTYNPAPITCNTLAPATPGTEGGGGAENGPVRAHLVAFRPAPRRHGEHPCGHGWRRGAHAGQPEARRGWQIRDPLLSTGWWAGKPGKGGGGHHCLSQVVPSQGLAATAAVE